VKYNGFNNFSSVLTLLLISFCLIPCLSKAHLNEELPEKLIVGVVEYPPYSMKMSNGDWKGIGIELWRAVAEDLGIKYDIREYSRIKQTAEAIQAGQVDIVPSMSMSVKTEMIMDFSHAFYRSGLGIAVATNQQGHGLINYFIHLVSLNSLRVIALLLIGALIAAMTVWIFESKKNRAMFGESFPKGLGQSLWWAVVTMTTVGYGDKAPRSIGGRVVAVVWMFFSIILIASYTAVVTTSLTVGELSGKVRGPRDLPDVRVGALARSETKDFLSEVGIPILPTESVASGLHDVIEGNIDAFVDDEAQLKYLVKTQYPGEMSIVAETFAHYYVGMAMPSESPLREPLNQALLAYMETDEWKQLYKRYIGFSF
jgi:ABC-type amino acid transport substrate-binding protein